MRLRDEIFDYTRGYKICLSLRIRLMRKFKKKWFAFFPTVFEFFFFFRNFRCLFFNILIIDKIGLYFPNKPKTKKEDIYRLISSLVKSSQEKKKRNEKTKKIEA